MKRTNKAGYRHHAMKAVIFCDNFAFAIRARSILLRAARQPDVNVRWNVKAWPIVALDQANFSEENEPIVQLRGTDLS